jgi:hypothetical protein
MPRRIDEQRPATLPVSPTTPTSSPQRTNPPTSPSPSAPNLQPPTAIRPPDATTAHALGLQETTPKEPILKTWFAPYDDVKAPEMALIDEVIAARKTDPRTYAEGENPYKINYAVYNIRCPQTLEKLVEAERAGVDVQILIEDHQLDPAKDWNIADEYLVEHGFELVLDHKTLTPQQRKTADLIGIKRDTLMHLKSRIFSYPDPETGEIQRKLLTGSMNPGDHAADNDENLMLINDPRIVAKYAEMYEAVRDNKQIRNHFDNNAPINVMFTGAPVSKTGNQQVAQKIFEWIDKEQEAIFLSVFSLRNITSPHDKQNLVEKLKAAQDRGVSVVVVTDKKQADGVDVEGNRVTWDDPTDELLQKAGIPVYEALNDKTPFNAMHAKSAIFGLTDMKIITDTGNWTGAALGSRANNRPQNEESFLFVDSSKLDDNRTGMRYLGNFLNLLREYAPQNPDQPSANEMINKLASHPQWPRVPVDFSVMATTFLGQDVYVTGDHPALGNWLKEGPGLKLNTQPGRYPFWESGGSLELPFGTEFQYKVIKRNPDGSVDWKAGENGFLIVDPTDARFGNESNGRMIRSDAF